MEINILTNGYKVISHGDVILYDTNSEMKLDIKTDSDFRFSVVMKFSKSEDGKRDFRMLTEENTIVFECYNFNPRGSGTVDPISIATVNGKEWLIHFWSYIMGDEGPRRVEYTLLEKE